MSIAYIIPAFTNKALEHSFSTKEKEEQLRHLRNSLAHLDARSQELDQEQLRYLLFYT
jgi:hypothetical protein